MDRVACSCYYPYIPPPPGPYTTWTALATSANVVPESRAVDKKRALMAAVRHLMGHKTALIAHYGAEYIRKCESAVFHNHPLVGAWLEAEGARDDAHRFRAANGQLLVQLREAQDRQPVKVCDRPGTFRCVRCELPVETTTEKGRKVTLANSIACPLCPGDIWLCTSCLPHSGWTSAGGSHVCPECRMRLASAV
jgi:hypothetical protein